MKRPLTALYTPESKKKVPQQGQIWYGGCVEWVASHPLFGEAKHKNKLKKVVIILWQK